MLKSQAMPSPALSGSLRRRLLLAVAPVVLVACGPAPAPSSPGGPGPEPTAGPAASGSAAPKRPPRPVEAEGRPLFIDEQQVKAPLSPCLAWG